MRVKRDKRVGLVRLICSLNLTSENINKIEMNTYI